MLTRALLSVIAGAAAWLAAAAACLGGFVLLFLLFNETRVFAEARSYREFTRVALALVLLLAPLAAGVAALAGAFALLRRIAHHDLRVSAIVAGILCGATLWLILLLITDVNGCEFDVSLPLWWVQTDPDC